jgi:hypothetical protein
LYLENSVIRANPGKNGVGFGSGGGGGAYVSKFNDNSQEYRMYGEGLKGASGFVYIVEKNMLFTRPGLHVLDLDGLETKVTIIMMGGGGSGNKSEYIYDYGSSVLNLETNSGGSSGNIKKLVFDETILSDELFENHPVYLVINVGNGVDYKLKVLKVQLKRDK